MLFGWLVGGGARLRWRLACGARERTAVHALALAGRRRTVLKNMPEMPAAMAAMHLGAHHEEAAVAGFPDGVDERRPKARPPGAAVELGAGVEQRLAAAGAMVDSGSILLVEWAGAGA